MTNIRFVILLLSSSITRRRRRKWGVYHFVGRESLFLVGTSPCPVLPAFVSQLFPPRYVLFKAVVAKIVLQPVETGYDPYFFNSNQSSRCVILNHLKYIISANTTIYLLSIMHIATCFDSKES